jgi:hypothetical protein
MTLSKTTRILVGIGSLLLLITFFVPLWQIMLWAPQYPEGLSMKIWHNNLSGNVDIINGLNHYIGMKQYWGGNVPGIQVHRPAPGVSDAGWAGSSRIG